MLLFGGKILEDCYTEYGFKTFLLSALLNHFFITDSWQMFSKESKQVHACMDIGWVLQANVKPQ